MQYKNLTKSPIGTILQLIGAKWKILIINELLTKKMRFMELKKCIGCTAKVLTSCLRELEDDGLVIREEFDVTPPKVEYYLSDIGYTLKPVLDAMQKWGKEYKHLRKLMDKYNKHVM